MKEETKALINERMEHYGNEPIHLYFELSYAHYLVIARTCLQSMPVEWQKRFVRCLLELDAQIDWRPKAGNYEVTLRREDGKLISIVHDPYNDYERGRRKIPLKDI